MRTGLVVGVACAFALAWMPGCTSTGNPNAPGDASAEDSAPPAIPEPTSSDPTIRKGWSAMLQRGCATCHASADAGILSGQTDPVSGTTTYGSNLTPDPDTGMDGWSASAIVDSLRKGIDDQGQPLCPSMPRYADMPDDEASAIAAYLASLTAVHHAVPSSVCPPTKPVDAGLDAAMEAGDDGGDGGEGGAVDSGPDGASDAPSSDGDDAAPADAGDGG